MGSKLGNWQLEMEINPRFDRLKKRVIGLLLHHPGSPATVSD
jgi:hypothetical protein